MGNAGLVIDWLVELTRHTVIIISRGMFLMIIKGDVINMARNILPSVSIHILSQPVSLFLETARKSCNIERKG